jgi:hypothetical protein
MTSKLKTDVLETVSGSGTIALTNQLSGMTYESMAAGSVIQVVTKSYSNNSEVSTTSTSYVALGSAFQLAITPKYANSLIICDIHFGMQFNNTAGSPLICVITKAGVAMNSATYGSSYTNIVDSRSYTSNSLREFDAAGGTSAITYGMSFKGQGGNTVFAYHGQSAYHITLTEIKQ